MSPTYGMERVWAADPTDLAGGFPDLPEVFQERYGVGWDDWKQSPGVRETDGGDVFWFDGVLNGRCVTAEIACDGSAIYELALPAQ